MQSACLVLPFPERKVFEVQLSLILFIIFLVIAFDSFRISAELDSVNPSKGLVLASVKRNK